MEVIWIVAIAILGVVGAAISRQMTDEFKAWMPWLISFIIDRAVRMLPESQRERFAEEWRSHVIEIPGDAGKLIVALGFFVASSKRAGIPAAAGKRIIDIIFSGAAIVALAPLLVVLALLIKLDSPGPVLLAHARIGRNGKRFHVINFRTTSLEDELPEGFRVTRIGVLLRSASLDEMPQLFNVLVGDMSLVGPRPASLDPNILSVLHQSDIKPGVVFDDESRNLIAGSRQDQRYTRELNYLQNRSLLLDLKIMARSVYRLFF